MASFEDEEASTPPPVATNTSTAWRKAIGFEKGHIQQLKDE